MQIKWDQNFKIKLSPSFSPSNICSTYNLVWILPKAEPEKKKSDTRSLFGSDPRQSEALGKQDKKGRKASEGWFSERVTAVGNCASVQLGPCWNTAFQIQELFHKETFMHQLISLVVWSLLLQLFLTPQTFWPAQGAQAGYHPVTREHPLAGSSQCMSNGGELPPWAPEMVPAAA